MMRLFRLKFILLGLFLFVCNVWSRNCGTEYDDAASNAFLSDLVVVGRVSQKLPLGYEKYKATIRIQGKRNVYKGQALLKRDSAQSRKSDMITVGVFQDVPADGVSVPGVGECIYTLDRDTQYIFFLNSTSQKKYFTVTAVPIASHIKNEFKRGKKDIKKILCKSGDCVTPPIASRGLKNASIQFGKRLELNCRLKRQTFPVTKFIWFKDGVDITDRSGKGFSIKDSKKGSVLRIKKTLLSDNGTYECVAKNVAGEIRQQAVINIIGVNAPQAASGSMKDKRQKFRGILKLNCRIKKGALPRAEFSWYKNGQPITPGDRKGVRIRNRETQSRLTMKRFLQSDAGVYLCKAKNAYGEINQTSKVTVINEPKLPAPKRKIPCLERDKHWCLNNGTCMMYVELKDKFCTCDPKYGGSRCEELVFLEKSREEKLAQDRNLVIVGIISAILLFIGICVASYFLAKRRRDQFYRRRRRSNNGHIEDNIPQIYRPLIGCDDIDGLKKSMTGFGVPKGTQTMETCFVGNEKDDLHLYINPMTGYLKNKNERKTAVSLESNPRPTYNGSNESLDETKQEQHESNSDNNTKSNPGSKRNSINNSASDGGPSEIFKLMNDLNPKKKSGGADNNPNSNPNSRNTGANKPNIPTTTSPASTTPPAFNLDTDSEDDVLNDDTPLTPLHISEDEDNNADFPKIKQVKSKPVNAVNNQTKQLNDPTRINNSKNEMKSKQYPPKQPPPQSQHKQQQPIPPNQPDNPREQQYRQSHPHQQEHQSRPQGPQDDRQSRPTHPPDDHQSRQNHPQDRQTRAPHPQQEQHSRAPHPSQEPRSRPIHPHARPHPQHQSRSAHPAQQHPPRPLQQERQQQSRPPPQERQQHQSRPPPQEMQQHQSRPPPQEMQQHQSRPPPQEMQQHQSRPPPQERQQYSRPPSQERQQPKAHPRHQSKPPQQHPPTEQQSPSQPPLPNTHQHTSKHPHQPRQHQHHQPRSDKKSVKPNEAPSSPGEKLYASTSSSGYSDSDSSTTTEGCDSPDTAFRNSQDLYNPESPPVLPKASVKSTSTSTPVDSAETQWNEPGSPEQAEPSRQPKVSSRYKPPPDIGVSREQYYSASGPTSPARKGAGVRDHGRNYRQSR